MNAEEQNKLIGKYRADGKVVFDNESQVRAMLAEQELLILKRLRGSFSGASFDMFKEECDDIDEILRHMGFVPEQCRSSGGRLLVAKIKTMVNQLMAETPPVLDGT